LGKLENSFLYRERETQDEVSAAAHANIGFSAGHLACIRERRHAARCERFFLFLLVASWVH